MMEVFGLNRAMARPPTASHASDVSAIVANEAIFTDTGAAPKLRLPVVSPTN